MTKNKQKGFTIIEVALVLAVAALIFLVVFLAVPALQRNQRDDARKRDVSNVVQAVVNAVANSGGKTLQSGLAYDNGVPRAPIPGSTNVELGDYLDTMSGNIEYIMVFNNSYANYTSTNGINGVTPYDLVPATGGQINNGTPFINKIVVYMGAECWSGDASVSGSMQTTQGVRWIQGARDHPAAVSIRLENGGGKAVVGSTGAFFCQNVW